MEIVFVHGALVRDGAWWWHLAAQELAARGLRSSAPALPSCGETGLRPGTGGPSLAEDVAAVSDHLARLEGDLVVVGHSYGSVVAAEACVGVDVVKHVVVIAGTLPQAGESLASLGDGSPAPYLDVRDDGTFGLHLELATETFLHDCDPALEAPAHERMVRQSLSATTTPVRASVWADVPSTYVVCAHDRGTPPDLQRRHSRRAGRTVELATGHHCFISRPAAVADLVADVVADVVAGVAAAH